MFCNEVNGRHPEKMQWKNHLHHAVRMRSCAWCDASMTWCVRNQSSVSQLIFCLMFLSGWKSSVCSMSYVWDHAHQRMHSPTQDCATRKPTLLYYSCCFDFVCSTSPGGNLPQSLWTYPTAWHTAYPTIPRTYPKSKSPRHTGPHGQVFWLVSYFPKGFGTFCINLWMLYLRPKCQSTHGTPWNDFLTVQARRCNSHCRNNITNL